MAYIRIKGNQVLLVHGIRNPDTGAVEQQTLFTFYTKGEIEAAIGEYHSLFRDLVSAEHPRVRFDWAAIDLGLRQHLDRVPDASPAHHNSATVELRRALVELTRVVWELDPHQMQSAAQLVDDHRAAIALVAARLQELLRTVANPAHADRDSPSLWRQAAKSRHQPLEGWEELDDLWEEGKYQEVEDLAGLLVEAFPMFTDGHNYLGRVALENGDFKGALRHFIQAEAVGRQQFPSKIAKSHYWQDMKTRPFLRAVMLQVAVHNRLADYEAALALCDRLEGEFGQEINANQLRIPMLLNTGEWARAAKVSVGLTGLYPSDHLPAALAYWELDQRQLAREHFASAALQLPRTAALFVAADLPDGVNPDWRDHNEMVALLRELGPYRATHRRTFKALLAWFQHPKLQAAVLAAEEVRKAWKEDRASNAGLYHQLQRLSTMEHAREVVAAAGFPA